MNLILIGFKGCGKTAVGKALAKKLGLQFIDLDALMEKLHLKRKKEKLTFRQLYKAYGKSYFKRLEHSALLSLKKSQQSQNIVLATGGSTPLPKANQEILKEIGVIICLDVEKSRLYKQIIKRGIPAFFNRKAPKKSFESLWKKRKDIYKDTADIYIKIKNEPVREVIKKIIGT